MQDNILGAADSTAGPVCDSRSCVAADLPPLIQLDSQQIDVILRAVPDGASNVQDVYPLSPLQEGMLFHHLANERSDSYVLWSLFELRTPDCLDAFINALQRVIDRHDVLRSAVLWEKLPHPVQVVHRQARLPVIPVRVASHLAAREQLQDKVQSAAAPFDVRKAPLLKLWTARTEESGCWALLQIHHLVCDHDSLHALLEETLAFVDGRHAQLPEPGSFREYVAHIMRRAQAEQAEEFFRAKLGDVHESTVPFGVSDVHGDGHRVIEAREAIPPALAEEVRRQARQSKVSVAALFHAVWGLVVARTSGRDDVVYGTVLLMLNALLSARAGAQRPRRVLGVSVNTLPLRLRLQDLTARALVEQTHRELLELLRYEHFPLAKAQGYSGVARGAPLFSAILNFRQSPRAPDRERGAAGIRLIERHGARTNYPLSLSVDDAVDGFVLTAQSDAQIDPRLVIGYVQMALRSLLDALARSPLASVSELTILPDDERHRLLQLFNATRQPYPDNRPICELFEEQVVRTPDAVAVTYETASLSYAGLNERANRLARHLRSRGAAEGEFVPVVMARSLDMLIAQLAILKCGCVYVPLDPDIPLERRKFIVRDCAARLVLSDGRAEAGQEDCVQWIDVAAARDTIAREDASDLKLQIAAHSPAYVMYTSGSTGSPKGVVVPHRAISRLAFNNGYAVIGPHDCIAHHSNPTFDASTFEIWCALLNGATVAVVPQPVILDAQRFATLLRQHRVTVLYLSVGLFSQYAEVLANVFSKLRYLMVGGEALEPGSVRRVLRRSPPAHLLNMYGPTECTTFATKYLIGDVAESATSIPIGQPIANTSVYILDQHRKPVPIGVMGEIYVGGRGVACGYLNRPDLTRERFVPDPFEAEPASRMYKTGDLGRWRADGCIEFLGREDQQVKLRGFRIELGEIEAHLTRHPQVSEAAVLAREDAPGEKRLVAYVVLREQSQPVLPEELRAFAKAQLPDYMVPSAFITLPVMPLTSTGKVNRRVLPRPQLDSYASQAYECPVGSVETALAEIWQQLLRLERIGRRDDFFALGGNSLAAMKLVAAVADRFAVPFRIHAVFSHAALCDMAQVIGSLPSGQVEIVTPHAEELEQGVIE